MFNEQISEINQEIAIKEFLDLLNRKPEDCLSIDGLLEVVGNYFQADRSYIFEENEAKTIIRNTFEWCKPGVISQKDNLQNVPVETIELWKKHFRINGTFYTKIDDFCKASDPELYNVLEPQKIDSVIVSPLVLGGEIVGLFGIDNPKKHQNYLLLMSVMASSIFKELLSIRAMEVAKSANEAKSSFLFSMSHDIRTPLNAIVGYNALIKKDIKNPEKLLHYQEKIETSSDFLLSLINSVLDMARIESGKAVLDETITNVGDNTGAIIEVFESEAKKKNIKFEHKVEIKHRHIYCDITKIRQIFTNLLGNAVKYTTTGGKITITTKELPCSEDGYVIIQTTVQDTGIGMSEEFLPHIFEAFTREQNSTASGIAGTGLGMPIVKNLVTLMGGTIDVESQLGKGTKFTLILKHKIADEAYYKKASVNTNLEKRKLFKDKKILLAEDNDMNAEIAVVILEDLGFIVERAKDGVICIEMMKNAPENYYDLILMDIQMPHLDGYKATEAIRSMEVSWKKTIPIIALTANAFEEDKKRAFEAGMNAHISKPIKIQNLIDTLNSFFN